LGGNPLAPNAKPVGSGHVADARIVTLCIGSMPTSARGNAVAHARIGMGTVWRMPESAGGRRVE